MNKYLFNLVTREGVSLMDLRQQHFEDLVKEKTSKFNGSNIRCDIRIEKPVDFAYKVKLNYNADDIQMIRIEKSGEDLMSLYQEVVSVLERRLKKQYDIIKNGRKHGKSIREIYFEDSDDNETYDHERGEFLANLADSKTVEIEEIPLSLAFLEFEMLDFGFYVFKNVDTGKTEVLYNKIDGGTGRIITE